MNGRDEEQIVHCAECDDEIAHVTFEGEERCVGIYADDCISFTGRVHGADVTLRCPGCRSETDSPSDEKHERPTVGTEVVEHTMFGGPRVGEVVPRDTWDHPNELTPDVFIVEFEELRGYYTVDEATTTGKVVHIDP